MLKNAMALFAMLAAWAAILAAWVADRRIVLAPDRSRVLGPDEPQDGILLAAEGRKVSLEDCQLYGIGPYAEDAPEGASAEAEKAVTAAAKEQEKVALGGQPTGSKSSRTPNLGGAAAEGGDGSDQDEPTSEASAQAEAQGEGQQEGGQLTPIVSADTRASGAPVQL